MKKMYKILAVLVVGFAGGSLSPWVLSWVASVTINNPGDAINIANTYIVFTTFFFVGVTVVLAVAGYVFTQQFSATKETQEIQVLSELKEKVRSNEQLAIQLLDEILKNPDAKRHVNKLLQNKVHELIQSHLADSESNADQANLKVDQLKSLALKVKPDPKLNLEK